MPNATSNLDTIFIEAIEIPGAADRAAYLDRACGPDDVLRRRVGALVAAHFRAGESFLERPAADADSTVGFAPYSDETATALEVGTAIGPYVLREQIGEGGMGLVFVAEQTHPVRRKVALKVIKPGMDSRQVVARFEAERQALALMGHPNIAKVLDAGTTPEGRPYFVMELVKGEPITGYCDRNRLTLRERLGVFLQVCQAVQHAHQKGVIHRDLKPSNILIEVHDVTPVAKVIDFGIAKAVGQSLTDKTMYTAVAQFVGTPLYMSPEQAGQSSLDVDTRTDVYALGVLLYELLTGTTPIDPETFRKAGLDEVRRIIREDEPPRPSARMSTLKAAALSTVADKRGADPRRLTRQVRGELDWVVMKCLEKDRNRRYESASALAAEVQRYLADEPVLACPPSTSYRLRKFARRNHRAVLGAVASLMLAVLLVVAGGWLYLDRTRERERVAGGVRESLAGAQAAIEAGDLGQAGQWVAEARGRLGPDPARLGDLAAEADRVGSEIDTRRADAGRYQQFLELVNDAQDKMGYSQSGNGDAVAEKALGLYGVQSDDGWVSRLGASHLTAAQKDRVLEAAYVTLVSLADYHIRWLGNGRRGLDLLKRAEGFHEPTRAFYFARSRCHASAKNAPATADDERRYKGMAGRTAWDYYLPGHTAGWEGDLEEAIRGYEVALRIQPNHYNSLFFLALRLGTDKINRRPEAIQALRGCMALRPTDLYPYLNRAEFLQKLGRLDEAEADYTAAIERAANDADRAQAYQSRAKFYADSGQPVKAREDKEKRVAPFERMLAELTDRLGADHRETLVVMNNLAVTHTQLGRFGDAIRLLEPTLEKRKVISGANHAETLAAMYNLGFVYFEVGRFNDAIRLLEQALEKYKTVSGTAHLDTVSAMMILGNAYVAAGRHEDGIRLLEQALEKCKAVSGSERSERSERSDHLASLLVMNNLGVAYGEVNRGDDSIRILKVALEKREAVSGRDHPATLTVMSNLAAGYDQVGRLHEAERVNREIVVRRRRVDGPGIAETANALAKHGLALLRLKRYAEAEPVLSECLAIREKLIPDDWLRFNTMSMLGGSLLGQIKYAEAEPLLHQSFEKMKEREATIPRGSNRLTEAVVRLVQFYEATGRPERAAEWRRKIPLEAAPPPRLKPAR